LLCRVSSRQGIGPEGHPSCSLPLLRERRRPSLQGEERGAVAVPVPEATRGRERGN